jgi:hypothetical protein
MSSGVIPSPQRELRSVLGRWLKGHPSGMEGLQSVEQRSAQVPRQSGSPWPQRAAPCARSRRGGAHRPESTVDRSEVGNLWWTCRLTGSDRDRRRRQEAKSHTIWSLQQSR